MLLLEYKLNVNRTSSGCDVNLLQTSFSTSRVCAITRLIVKYAAFLLSFTKMPLGFPKFRCVPETSRKRKSSRNKTTDMLESGTSFHSDTEFLLGDLDSPENSNTAVSDHQRSTMMRSIFDGRFF